MKALGLLLMVNALVFGITNKGWSQDSRQSSYHVVVGAFAQLENAVKFTDAANHDNFQAQYAIQTDRNLYYVFILNVTERQRALAFLLKIKAETKYKDAWLYIGKLGDITMTASESKPMPLAETKPTVETVALKELPKRDSTIEPLVIALDSLRLIKPVQQIVDAVPAGKPFYFKLINSESGATVMGEIQLSEPKTTEYLAVNGNELVYLKPPKNGSGVFQITAQAPGYKLAKLSLDYNSPSFKSSGVGDKQEAIITFELVRVANRDYIDFNKVRFLTNTNILEPSSQSELDGLVILMKENKKFTIKIHGHCNGTESRDIVTLGTSTNFFALDGQRNKKETATPKQLTEYRAEAVKNYLVSQGIIQSQITTKGEGAKMMIYPPSSTLANKNDRVEIEVLKSKR